MNQKKTKSSHKPANAGRPLLSVCMIVRDEESNLDRCLRSVRQIADEIIVVDTGSQDRTVEIARRFGAKVSHFEWCDDFAAARNAALAQATGQWILQMDADEELTTKPGRHIHRLVNSAPSQCSGFFIPVRCHGIEDYGEAESVICRLLLFRNRPGLCYRSRIHEYLEYAGEGPVPEYLFNDDIVIEHHGYMPDQLRSKRKAERNLRLLEMAIKEEPEEPYHQYNLGLQYYSMRRLAEAVEPLRRAVKLCANPSASFLPNAYGYLAVALAGTGHGDEVLALISEAEMRLTSPNPGFYCNAGEALRAIGDYDRALACFQRAVDMGNVSSAATVDFDSHTWKPRLGMGLICETRGRFDQALRHYEEGLAAAPTNPLLNCRAAVVLGHQGQLERARPSIERVLQSGPLPEQDILELCEVLASLTEHEESLPPHLMEAVSQRIREISPTPANGRRLSALCVRFQEWEHGIAAATACLEQSEDALTRVNRGYCHFAVGHYEEAAKDFAAAGTEIPTDVVSTCGSDIPQPPTRKDQVLHSTLTAVATTGASCVSTPVAEDGVALPVSIIVPVLTGVEQIRRCVESIVENTPDDLYELVIIDNTTSDSTKDFLSMLTGDVKVVSNETNGGFATSCHQGSEVAIGEYLVFLSDNAEPRSGWLEHLLCFLEKEPSCGVVGAKIVQPDGILHEAGAIVFSDGTLHHYGQGLDADDPRVNFVRDVDFCSPTALALRRDLWEKVGGFDSRYVCPAYQAADLCFAARQHGYRVLYQPAAVVVQHQMIGDRRGVQ